MALLEAVGRPVPVKVKPRLAEIAAERRSLELTFAETSLPTGASAPKEVI